MVQLSPEIKKKQDIPDSSPDGLQTPDIACSSEVKQLKKIIDKKRMERKNRMKLTGKVNRDMIESRDTETPDDFRPEQ